MAPGLWAKYGAQRGLEGKRPGQVLSLTRDIYQLPVAGGNAHGCGGGPHEAWLLSGWWQNACRKSDLLSGWSLSLPFLLCSPKHALETSSSLPWLVPTERLAKAHHKQAHLEPRQLARWDWRPVMWARVLFRTHPLTPSPVFGLTLLVSGFVF